MTLDGAGAQAGVGRDVALTFGGRISLTLAILIGDVVLARTMGPEGKGAFVVVLALSSLGAAILAFGLERSLAVFAAKSLESARRAMANALLWVLVVGSLGAIAILVLSQPADAGGRPGGVIASILPSLTSDQLAFVALALPLELAYAIGLVGLLGRQRLLAFNSIRLMRRAVVTLLIIAAVAIGRLDLTTLLALNLVAMATTVASIAAAIWNAGYLGFQPDRSMLRAQLSFGLRNFAGNIAERLHFRIDAFLLASIVSVAATGVYSVALGLAETLWYLPTAFGLVLFSRAVNQSADTAAIASAMTRSMLALVVAMAVPLWLIAPTMVAIVYGPQFIEAGVALQIMLPGVVAYSIVAVLSQYLIAQGVPGRVTVVLVAGLLSNVGANLVLMPRFGLFGAAGAATLSYATTAVGMLLLFTNISGRGVRETLVLQRSDLDGKWIAVRQTLARPGHRRI